MKAENTLAYFIHNVSDGDKKSFKTWKPGEPRSSAFAGVNVIKLFSFVTDDKAK
jgi:hypothetical protein